MFCFNCGEYVHALIEGACVHCGVSFECIKVGCSRPRAMFTCPTGCDFVLMNATCANHSAATKIDDWTVQSPVPCKNCQA